MKVIKITTILALIIGFFVIFLPDVKAFNNLSDCLITSDIGIYSYKSQRANMGKGSGVVGLAGHFGKDHNDTVCTGDYSNINQIRGLPVEELRQKLVSVSVHLTQHSGSDSDKWLLHEVERGFRRSKDLQATYVSSNPLREINGSKIWYTWGYYEWVSNNVVVYINFTDLTGTKPEPLEIVQAYLQKHPSTIPSTLILDKAHDEKWLKDEMERRLWLCDKWFYQLQLQKAELKTVLQNTVGSMQVFLNYREKYYGIAAQAEKQILEGYLNKSDGTGIRNKLKEYKSWWEGNEDKPISIQ